MKKLKIVLLALASVSIYMACSSDNVEVTQVPSDQSGSETEEEGDTSSDEGPGPGIGLARDITSFDLVSEMGVGWNLGNSFDTRSRDKTLWGNPLPTKAMIDAVARRGFRTLRIPVTWNYNQSDTAPFTIEEDYLDRVQSVVDYGFQNRMHVIINVHHDNDWVVPAPSEAPTVFARLGSLWTQVSERFQAYNDSLIFEVLNEPRIEGIPEEWTGGTPEGRDFVNQYNAAAVEAIRNTGGNNALRHLMIPTWAASTLPVAVNDLVIPDDPKIIISLHSYFPWPFAGMGEGSWGTDQDRQALRNELEGISNRFIVQEQRPVILGEFGSVSEGRLSDRLDYSEFYAREAAELGLMTVVWDDGGRFRMFNRENLTWPFGNIADAIILGSSQVQ